MSKKKNIFTIRKDEKIIFQAAANFCPTGKYFGSVFGDAILTDKRFIFKSDLSLTRVDELIEIQLSDVDFVSKTGIPLLTRSIYISCSYHNGKNYRFNVYKLTKWLKAFQSALPEKNI